MIEKAYAKVNLFLNVVERREDGYHTLNMVTHPIELHDELRFEKAEQDQLIGSDFSDDIILKTLKLMRKKYDIPGVRVTLVKHIPIGAGLGGGSADAAATLRGVNRLYQLGLSLNELAEIGVQLGADVPMCVYNKPAVVGGIGEKIQFIKNVSADLILVVPDEHVSTKEVFINTSPEKMKYKSSEELFSAMRENDINKINLSKLNDLENVTVKVSKKCFEIRKKIKNINKGFMMTGSGSVFYNLYESEEELERNAKELDSYAINWIHTKLR